MIDVILPIFICAALFRADIVWAFVYCAIIALRTFHATDVISPDGLPVLYVVTFLCILQIYASFRTRGYRPYPTTIRVAGLFMGLFRLPVNFIFARELIVKLKLWHILPAFVPSPEHQKYVVKIADSVELMMLATILLSVILLILHFTLAYRGQSPR